MAEQSIVSRHRWGMVVDVDRCTGCQACVVACQAENNIPTNTEETYLQHRAHEWIRVERYWVGEYPDIKARFLPVLCQQCANAPCEPVCPVYATHRSDDGLNTQVYNRCVGTRYCGNNCPWHVRFFNFAQPEWSEPLHNQLNSDVTVRFRGIMEKCTFCVQRIRRAERIAKREGRALRDLEFQPACAQACPPDVLVFGDLNDQNSRVSQLARDPRGYLLLGELGTEPSITYLKKVDPFPPQTKEAPEPHTPNERTR
ncbi:MAG: 4Fe-4S dicluster domain-containing protein [Chloroflexi bacterium]|nr:4Fe-4S dicluster domain-containing protein [Chloroflexota bacterium]